MLRPITMLGPRFTRDGDHHAHLQRTADFNAVIDCHDFEMNVRPIVKLRL